jgi:hypothetical protein
VFLVCRSREDDCITTPSSGLCLIGINSVKTQFDATASRLDASNGADQLVTAVRPVRMKQPCAVNRPHDREVLLTVQNTGPKDLRLERGRPINVMHENVDSQATGDALTIGSGRLLFFWSAHSCAASGLNPEQSAHPADPGKHWPEQNRLNSIGRDLEDGAGATSVR